MSGKREDKTDNDGGLRSRAEQRVNARQAGAPPGGETSDTLRRLHELQVHKVELELQNAELRQTRQELETAVARYVDLYDLAPAGYFTLGTDGHILEVNLTGARLLGVERAGLIGQRLGEFVAPAFRAAYAACLEGAFGSRGGAACEVELGEVELRGDADPPRHLRIEAIAVGAGRTCRLIVLDISRERQVALALERERRFLRQVIDASPGMIFAKDRAGRFVLANAAVARCYGVSPEAMVGRSDADFNADAREVEHFLRDDRQVMDSRTGKFIAEEAVTSAAGETRWFATHKVPLEDEDGRCGMVLGVATDITDRRRAEAALRDADRRKNEFLAMLGHELRNPLAPIANAAYILGRLGIANPRLDWAAQVIEQQVRHLTRLLDDLLNVARVVGGRIELHRERIELADLVRQALETARLLIDAKGHRLDVALPDEPLWLECDPVRLTQVLVNLLGNAAKYTDAGGMIQLEAALEGAELVITVRDDGMGIPADLLPQVFDLFTQGERALDRAQGGLGIGLALVRHMVELHGGHIAARSAGPGLGSEFILWLPVDDAPAAAREEPPSTDAAAPIRVLLVDDDPQVLESTAVMLEIEGHQVRTAPSGEAALRLLSTFRPQLVLLDIGMSDMDGYEAARQMRAMPDGDKLRLVALSGYGQEEARERSADAGFDAHLVKPMKPETLARLLASVGAGAESKTGALPR